VSTVPTAARLYIAITVALAGGAAAIALATLPSDGGDVLVFLALGAGAAVAQLRTAEVRANHGFPASTAFLVAGAMLLPASLVALIALAQYLPDVLLRRRPWPIEAFNVSNGTLNVLAAWLAARVVTGGLGDDGAGLVAAGLAAAVVFVALNHLLLGGVLKLARGHSLRASGLFSAESLSIDLVLALVGVAAAGLAGWNLALAPIVLAPLLLAHRLLRVLARMYAEPQSRAA
jgi:hypothetical protein